MMSVFTGKDTYVFEMTRGLITAKELMSIFKNTNDPLFIKGSDGKWCKVESVFESKSKNIVPVKLTTRDGIDLVVGSNSTFTCPTGDYYRPRVMSKAIRDLSNKYVLSADNLESFQFISLPDNIIQKIAYIARYFRYSIVRPHGYGYDLEQYRASVPCINGKVHTLEDIFKCSVNNNGSDNIILTIGVTNSSFNMIKEYSEVFGINTEYKDIPKIIWRCDINTRKKFWKYFTEFDSFNEYIDSSTGKHWAEFSLRDKTIADKFKIFLTSIGINGSIQYKRTRDLHSVIMRGEDKIAKLIDPFKEIEFDNTNTWSYPGWNIYRNIDGERTSILMSSKERFEIHKRLCKNEFYKEYYKYNINTKIKAIKECKDKMIVIGISDDNVYISLNGIFVRGGF